MRNVCVFAGQGTQYYNMGKELITHPTFGHWMKSADRLMQKRQNRSLLHSLYSSHTTPMNDFTLSHPALFAVQFAAAMCVEEPLDLVIGASLGDFVALTVCSDLSFEEVFNHILDQVEIFQKNLMPGKMIAVLESKEKIEDALKDEYAFAAISGPQHYTLSVPLESYSTIQTQLRSAGFTYLTLPVDYPFHSKWVDPVETSFLQTANKLPSPSLWIPLASCTTLEEHKVITPSHLWKSLRLPIKAQDAFKLFLKEDDQVIDCSPSGTTKGLLRSLYGNNSSIFMKARSLMSPYHKGKT